MEHALTLRRGVIDDAAALAAIAARTFEQTFGPDNRPEDMAAHLAAAYGPAQQGAELASPDYATLLIEDGATLVAFAQVRHHDPPPCVTGPAPIELHRFYVDRGWHGRGVAHRLMTEARAAAAARGGRTIWLSVWERNPRAIAFYGKCGFEDVGSTDFYVGPDRQTDRVMAASPTMGAVDIRRSSLASPDAARLIASLNAELKAAFPEPGATHFSLTGAQVVAGDGAFVVAYLDDVAVGCGAVRRLDETTAELKRMFVDPAVRGRGVGRAIVESLEREARRLGVTRVVLETGTRLAPAIKLYEGMGYAPIPLFGEYVSSPATSLCFGKSLG